MWIETLNINSNRKVLIRTDDIKIVEGSDEDTYCFINGIKVKDTYKDIKTLLLSTSSVYSTADMDFRLKHLLQEHVVKLYTTLDNEKAIQYVKELMACTELWQLTALKEKYGHNQTGQDQV